MKTFGFIKNNICLFMIDYEKIEDALNFKEDSGLEVSDIVEVPIGFFTGDTYFEGKWFKGKIISNPNEPTIEERLAMAEDTINFLLGL